MLRNLKRKFGNKDAKIIVENIVSLTSLQVIGMLLPLITLPYILRVIGFDNFGVIVLATSFITYFQSLTDFSFKITATRDVAIFKNSPMKMNLIYSRVLIVKGIFLVASLILIGILIFCVPTFREHKIIYIITALSLIGYAIFPEWFFQGIEKMRVITFLNISIKLFFTLCVFLFIKEKEDFWIYPLLQTLGLTGAGLVGQLIMVKKYKIKFLFIPINKIVRTIKQNFPIFINQFLPNLYNNSSTFLLGLMHSSTLVGIYQSILTIVNLAIAFIEILSRVFFPYLNRKKESFKSYMKIMISLVFVGIVLILALHPIIFWYLNVQYKQAFLILFILALGLVGYTFSRVFGLNYFIVHRKDKLVMNNTIISSIVGFILAYPLIYSFGIVGAAMNLSFSRWMMGGGLFYKYLKHEKQ